VCAPVCGSGLFVYIFIYVYIYIYTYTYIYICIYIYMCVCVCVSACVFAGVRVRACAWVSQISTFFFSIIPSCYGLATISRLLKVPGLFCRIQSLLQGSFAKETYNFKEPTNRSHQIYICFSNCPMCSINAQIAHGAIEYRRLGPLKKDSPRKSTFYISLSSTVYMYPHRVDSLNRQGHSQGALKISKFPWEYLLYFALKYRVYVSLKEWAP